jgi:hypothetical protein
VLSVPEADLKAFAAAPLEVTYNSILLPYAWRIKSIGKSCASINLVWMRNGLFLQGLDFDRFVRLEPAADPPITLGEPLI